MITLYVRNGCPYCEHTTAEAEALHVPLSFKEISEEGVAEDLQTRGGKIQLPYMVDDETGTEMYESEDIISYLHERFGKQSVA